MKSILKVLNKIKADLSQFNKEGVIHYRQFSGKSAKPLSLIENETIMIACVSTVEIYTGEQI